MSEEAEPELLSLVYEHAIRALDEQRGTVDNLRERAGVVLGAASIASSFLGGIALADGGLGLWAVLGLAAFVAVGLLVFAILWPYPWVFGFEPHDLVRDYVDTDPPASATDTKRNLTIFAGDYLAENSRILNALWWVYRLAIAMLVALIAFWLIDLGTTP